MTEKNESMVRKLFAEVFQTERAARERPAALAERLGPSAPSDAFFAIAGHARKAQKTLGRIADARDHHPTMLGITFGETFSLSRNRLSEFRQTLEQSYRSTLLSLHHGSDLIVLFRAAANEEEDEQLVTWCDDWLRARKPLVDDAVAALAWFADHRELALSAAKKPDHVVV